MNNRDHNFTSAKLQRCATDGAMLKGLKAGDKIKFPPEQVNGQFTVTKIEKAK